MAEVITFAIAGIVAIALILGIRWVAAKHAAGIGKEATAAIEAERGSPPDFVQAFGATAVALDFDDRALIVFDRRNGLETFSFDEIGTWFVGTVSQEIMSSQSAQALSDLSENTTVSARSTESKYVIVSDRDQNRICQVGILGDADANAARDAFQRAMPGKEIDEAIGAKSLGDLFTGQR